MTVSQLNMSWTVAPANDLLKVSLSVDWTKDTMVLVTEVPMLAPMMMGMDWRTVSTEITWDSILNKIVGI